MATVVPPLALGNRLGAGAFGEVFEGQDSVHGRVAVKVMTRAVGEDAPEWHKRKAGLLAEGQKLSAADHTNVVRVHSISEDPAGDSIRLCMAFCAGGSLQNVYEAGPLPMGDVRRIATEVTLGLDALHNRGMLHRDIKPGNLLLNAHGVALLGDFGLVTNDLVLGYGSLAGYADHVAYEVWTDKVTSVKSDIWALGMTLYRLVHGQTWYETGKSPHATVPAGGYANTLRWLPHVPAGWRRMIRKMLNDDPAKRFQTAQQVLSALGNLATPGWSTEVDADSVRWELASRTRKKVVEWSWKSPRKHEWSAWSEPLGSSGRRKTLAGSSAPQGRNATMHELDEFFADTRSD